MLIGVNGADVAGRTGAGKVYVFYGRDIQGYGFANSFDANTTANITINGSRKDDRITNHDEGAVNIADMNNDGIKDMIVSSQEATSVVGLNAGKLYIFYSELEDNTPPNITINLPANNANISGNFLINTSVNDTSNTNLVNLTIFNNTGNATAIIPMTVGAGTNTNGYWNATINSATLADGNYNLSVNATDTIGNVNISQNRSITIDNTAANATAIVPANSTIQTGSFLINASVNDSTSKVFNATFKLIGSTEESGWLYAELGAGTSANGYWNTTFDSTTLADGAYNITINATDFAGNQNIVNITSLTIDNTPPTIDITALSEANNSFINRTYSFINFTVTEANLEYFFVNLTGPQFSETNGLNTSIWDKDLVLNLHFEESNGSTTANDSSGLGNDGNTN